jgi:hypothetical protein
MCRCYVYAYIEDVLTFAMLARRRSVASSFCDALFSKAAAMYYIRAKIAERSQALTG